MIPVKGMRTSIERRMKMYTLHSILCLAGILMTAICLTGIIEGAKEDAEKRRLRRREQYRRTAYADVYRRRVKSENRTQLWKAVNK